MWTEDGKDNRTTTTYSPANTWPLNGITTTTPDPDGAFSTRTGLTSTVWTSRFWGAPTTVKDANGHSTKVTLDSAGRIVEFWKPTETGPGMPRPHLRLAQSVVKARCRDLGIPTRRPTSSTPTVRPCGTWGRTAVCRHMRSRRLAPLRTPSRRT